MLYEVITDLMHHFLPLQSYQRLQKQDAIGLSKAFIEEDFFEEDTIEIKRVKKFAMKPMDARNNFV